LTIEESAVTFFQKPRERSKPNGPPPIPVPPNILGGLDDDLRDVRDCMLSAQQAMREQKRRRNRNLVRHWQNMVDILRNSERDLLAIKGDWERRAPH
jgi:hypothetical protein